MYNKYVHMVAFILVIVGGLNWGLMVFDMNLVSMIVGAWPMLEQAVYALVGLSAIYLVVTHKASCTMCKGGQMSM